MWWDCLYGLQSNAVASFSLRRSCSIQGRDIGKGLLLKGSATGETEIRGHAVCVVKADRFVRFADRAGVVCQWALMVNE